MTELQAATLKRYVVAKLEHEALRDATNHAREKENLAWQRKWTVYEELRAVFGIEKRNDDDIMVELFSRL